MREFKQVAEARLKEEVDKNGLLSGKVQMLQRTPGSEAGGDPIPCPSGAAWQPRYDFRGAPLAESKPNKEGVGRRAMWLQQPAAGLNFAAFGA